MYIGVFLRSACNTCIWSQRCILVLIYESNEYIRKIMHMLCFLGFVTKQLNLYPSVKAQLPVHSVKTILWKSWHFVYPLKSHWVQNFENESLDVKPFKTIYSIWTSPDQYLCFMRSFCIIKMITVRSLNQTSLEQLWLLTDMPKAIVKSICYYEIIDIFVTISLLELKNMLCHIKILYNHPYFNTIIKLWTTQQQYWNIFSINIINKWQIYTNFPTAIQSNVS